MSPPLGEVQRREALSSFLPGSGRRQGPGLGLGWFVSGVACDGGERCWAFRDPFKPEEA